MKKVCVIGYPIKHSLSPEIHNYWLKENGIEGSYEKLEIHPDDFDERFKNLHSEGYVGCNITLPFKERAFELIAQMGGFDDSVESSAAIITGAVNTVSIINGKYIGKNTDYIGFLDNITTQHNADVINGKTIVLGAGGAARAIVMSLMIGHVPATTDNIPEIIITNRSKYKAEKIVDDLNKYKDTAFSDWNGTISVIDWRQIDKALEGANLLINTTSLGMAGQPPLDINLEHLPKDALVTDIVYRPLITPLLQAAQDRGNPIVDGLGMLLHQAAPGFEMWFADELNGRKVEVTKELRDKIEARL